METEIITPEIQVKLVGLTGPYRDCTYPIRKDEYVIGRSPECDMVLEEPTVSARHARIVRRGGHYELEDLHSTNGTFVAGVKIEIKKLRNEDRVRFDRFEFRFSNPLDVSRTVIAEAPGFVAADKTEIHEAGAHVPPPPGPPSPPQPLAELVQPPAVAAAGVRAASGSAGRTLGGFLLGFLVAYLLGVIPMTAITFARAAVRLDALPQLFRQAVHLHPAMHLHPAWTNVPWRDASVIVVALSLLLGLILGGWIFQNARRRGRFSSAMLLALGYVLLSLLLQAAGNDFNFAGLPMSYPMLIPALGAWGNFALCSAYFFAVVLLLGGLGTLLGKRGE